jgi:Protein of unknown function (DUF3568)
MHACMAEDNDVKRTVDRRVVQVAMVVTLLCGLQGCAAVALTLLSAGAGVGASAGIEHTVNGVAYRTFTMGQEQLRAATHTALRRMAIVVRTDETTDEGRKIVGEASDRIVEIELERVTDKTTRMRVTVKQGLLFRDKATAGEIVARTEQAVANGAGTLSRTKLIY